MTDVDIPPQGTTVRRKRRLLLLLAVLVAALMAAVIVFKWTSSTTTSSAEFDLQSISAATRSAEDYASSEPESKKYIDAHLDGERAAGRDISIAQARVAVLSASKRVAGKVYLVWSGGRDPAKVLVVSSRQRGAETTAVGFQTKEAATSTATSLSPPIDRTTHGGGRSDGRLEIQRSDCVDAWYTTDENSLRMSSCTELWRSGTSPEWIYHHFADATTPPTADKATITDIAIRSRIQQTMNGQVRGPNMVLSCSSAGSMTFYASVEIVNAAPVNPGLSVPANSCHGYTDLINSSKLQVGARVESNMTDRNHVSATGSYQTLHASAVPTWDDYFWAQIATCQPFPTCSRVSIDEAPYISRLW